MEPSPHTDTVENPRHNGIPSFELIARQLDEVKEFIKRWLTAPPKAAAINQLLEHLHSCSGKMIRPGLVLLSGAAAGKVTQKHVQIAAIVETIHNATLLHDDVIDEGRQRRGAPTINHLWGNESAVLLGDFLLGQVFKMCANLEPNITNIIATTAVRTCEGELRQVVERKNLHLTEAEYVDIITDKSAAIFGTCCRLGAMLAEAGENEVESLACFGLNSGIAFQITDDVLDITGDERKTGKTTGSDVDKHKLTLPVIHLLKKLDKKERENVYSILEAPSRNKDGLAEMLKTYGCLEYAQSRAREYIAKAVQAVSDLRENDGKRALIRTAEFIAARSM
jgi:octaprenyl-diphosphate synthase